MSILEEKGRDKRAAIVGHFPFIPHVREIAKEVWFDYHVNAVSGTRVVNPELALRCVSQGANFRQIKGVKRLTILR